LVAALKAKQAEDIRKLILKFNPVITDGPVADLLTQKGALAAVYPEFILPPRIAEANVLSPEVQTQLADRVAVTQRLLARLKEVPYVNSVPHLLNTLDNAIADSLAGYDGYLAPLANHMTALDDDIAQKVLTIAERDGTIVQLQTVIAGLENDLSEARSNQRLYEATVAAERQAEQNRAAAVLARWTGSVYDYVLGLREDGVLVDVRDLQDTLVLLKADRSKALAGAIEVANATPPPAVVPGKVTAVPPPVNLATVRDSANNNELGVVALEATADGAWRAKIVKLHDPKKPFKALDRLTLSLPAKK